MYEGTKKLLAEVESYYSEKLRTHGDTPLGVDWNGSEGQELRFQQLMKLVVSDDEFSLSDFGCGYGALLSFLQNHYSSFQYCGIDVSSDMISAAKKRYSNIETAKFEVAFTPSQIADYSVASGIFNVRMERSDSEWHQYLCDTLDLINESSRLGFSFNCLTTYSDPEKMRDYLYYANPLDLFDLCKKRYSSNIALLHDYGLFEFTILVRKQL